MLIGLIQICDDWLMSDHSWFYVKQEFLLSSVVLWENFSYPNSNNWKKKLPTSTALTTRWLKFFYTYFTLRSVKNYPFFWTSGINLVSQSSQLFKIRVLPAKIKLLIIWVGIIFCQQQNITTPNNLILSDFLYKLFIVQSYSR